MRDLKTYNTPVGPAQVFPTKDNDGNPAVAIQYPFANTLVTHTVSYKSVTDRDQAFRLIGIQQVLEAIDALTNIAENSEEE